MPQTTVLSAGTTAATSTDVAVAAGAAVTVGIFTTGGNTIPLGAGAAILIDTPGDDLVHTSLTVTCPLQVISGPCTLRVKRTASTVPIGIFTET